MPALSPYQNYLVTVQQGQASGVGQATGANAVTANATAKLNIEIQNHWISVLEALGLGGGGEPSAVGAALAGAQIFSGNIFLPEVATSHVWRGSTGIQLALQMRFDAWNDPVADVVTPVKTLLGMFLPTRNSGTASSVITSTLTALGASNIANALASTFLHPPGPTVIEYLAGDMSRAFTVMIGSALMLENLIPTTISFEFEERYDASGNPMAAMMTLGFMTFTTPDSNTVLSYFLSGGGGAGPSTSALPQGGGASGVPSSGTGGDESGSTPPGAPLTFPEIEVQTTPGR